MENITNVTAGENLKQIRKKFGLRQHEISGGEVTRNLISLIENNKTPLYEHTARLIAKNINLISSERDLDIYVSPEDILSPIRFKAKEHADTYIEDLRSYISDGQFQLHEEYVEEIEDFLKKWSIPEKKAIIYELLGDIYYYCKDTYKEYMYYTRALENHLINPVRRESYILIAKLIANCIKTEKYEEAIRLSFIGLSSKEKMPDYYKGIFHYNKALAHKDLGQFQDALTEIEESKEFLKNDWIEDLRKVLVLEGICFKKVGKKEDAIKSYLSVLDILNGSFDEMCLVYNNIVEIYRDADNKAMVANYKDKIMSILPRVSSTSIYLSTIYMELGSICEYLGDIEDSEYYLEKALGNAKLNKETNLIMKILLSIITLYKSTGKEDKFLALFSSFEDCLVIPSIDDTTTLIFKTILLYLDRSSSQEAKTLINKIIKEV